MTSHRYMTCSHCGTPYSYQSSGHWEGDYPAQLNDDRYCPACMKIIRDALAKVPTLFEWRDVPSTEYTIEELKALDEKASTEAHNSGFPRARRVFLPLTDLEDFGNTYRTIEVKTPKGVFRASFWTKNEIRNHPNRVVKHVYWDIVNNKASTYQS